MLSRSVPVKGMKGRCKGTQISRTRIRYSDVPFSPLFLIRSCCFSVSRFLIFSVPIFVPSSLTLTNFSAFISLPPTLTIMYSSVPLLLSPSLTITNFSVPIFFTLSLTITNSHCCTASASQLTRGCRKTQFQTTSEDVLAGSALQYW